MFTPHNNQEKSNASDMIARTLKSTRNLQNSAVQSRIAGTYLRDRFREAKMLMQSASKEAEK
jgi:hypothetical protein